MQDDWRQRRIDGDLAGFFHQLVHARAVGDQSRALRWRRQRMGFAADQRQAVMGQIGQDRPVAHVAVQRIRLHT